MRWLSVICLLIGLALLTAPETGKVRGKGPLPGGPNLDCITNWQCAGLENGCSLKTGRVPACGTAVGKLCSNTVPGYVCTGLGFQNSPCTLTFDGCQ